MIKFDLQAYVDGEKTQDFSQQIVTSIEKFTKLNESTLKNISHLITQKIEKNLQQGIDIYGNPVTPKIRPNGNPVFHNTGELLKSVVELQVAKDEYNIFINSNRSQIASYLQTGTENMTSREFFGISAFIEKDIDTILDQSFSKI